MAISGTTSTCQITTNEQFAVSGLSLTNLSTINITDENGLDVSQCFGIQTKIITVNSDNVTLSGDCDTSLEIEITRGISQPVSCDFVDYDQDGSGLVIFTFSDGSTSDNIHPECCTALGYTPEIDEEKCYYVCRWLEGINPEDCDNYSPTFQETLEGWTVFEYAGGGVVTTVPSVECCYAHGWVEQIQPNGDIKCVVDAEFEPCDGLVLVQPYPEFGVVPFLDPSTGQQTNVVPAAECCTANGLNYQIAQGGGFNCYNSLTTTPPTVTLNIQNPCCEGTITLGSR